MKFKLKIPIVLAVGAFLISACSTDVYEGEVATLAKKTSEMKSAFEDLVNNEDEAFFAREVRFAKRQNASLRLGDAKSDCNKLDQLLVNVAEDKQEDQDKAFRVALAKCKLHYQFAGKSPREVHRAADVKNARKLIVALNSYTTALAELAAAKDIDGLDASAAKLRDAVGSLVATSSKAAGTALPAATPALLAITQSINMGGKFVLWVFREYQKYLRFQRFRSAVIAADDAVSTADKPLGAMLAAFNRQLLLNQSGILNMTLNNRPVSDANIKTANKQYEALKALGSYDGYAVTANMAEAHRALRAAVENPKTQLKSLQTALKAFKDEVDGLVEAMKKLKEGDK